MMKVTIIITIISILTISCSNGHKSVKPDNIYSHIIDYCETNPIDSSLVYTGEEDNIPYCYLGLNGKTLSEVIDLFGPPIRKGFEEIYPNMQTDSYQWEALGEILQKCGDKVLVYTYTWYPRKNKKIELWLCFVRDSNNLRVIYGEQLDPIKYMNE